jgi:hypothetical protein
MKADCTTCRWAYIPLVLAPSDCQAWCRHGYAERLYTKVQRWRATHLRVGATTFPEDTPPCPGWTSPLHAADAKEQA